MGSSEPTERSEGGSQRRRRVRRKTYTETVIVRLQSGMYEKLEAAADEQDCTLTDVVRSALRAYLAGARYCGPVKEPKYEHFEESP